jgi:dienelactone hydrolase
LDFTGETTEAGTRERLFTVGHVPGVLWTPADAEGGRPLVLLGHSGGQHKQGPAVQARARQYVSTLGFAAAAIDAPGFGDRPRTERDEQFVTEFRARMSAGEPTFAWVAAYNAEVAEQAVPDWQAVLSALQRLPEIGAGGPVGYWGVSLGTGIGVPLAAAEPRIAAAVFGLAGGPVLEAAAATITVPVEFLLQWDDELVARDAGLALFDAFGSAEKTLHANPGRHAEVPRFEVDSSVRFFARHLAAD